MVAHATRTRSSFSGLRRIHAARDLAGVSALIEQAFADEMDSGGRNAVREMRWLGRLGFLFGWLDAITPPGEGMIPGFVWIEDRRIVGNATVRRLSTFGQGWMIGNVAVAPDLRGQGIGRSLVTACVDLARERNAEWIALQVRSDNAIARKLYQSMGFQDMGESIQLQRSDSVDRVAPPEQPVEGQLRAARPADTDQIYALAQSTVTEAMRWAEPLHRTDFELGLERRISNQLIGTEAVWRVVESGGQIWGAAVAEVNRWSQRGQVRLWVAQPRMGRIEAMLIDSVLAEMRTPIRSIAARIAGQQIAGREALEARGFKLIRALTHMRLNLRQA